MKPITYIIGRNPRVVEQKLGKAQKVEHIYTGGATNHFKAYYLNGEIEVVYIDNVADWITIHNKQDRTTENFIQFYGLTDLDISFRYQGKVQYINTPSCREVVYNSQADSSIQAVYIKAFTA